MEIVLTPEDRKLAAALGVSKEAFIEARKAEQETAASRAALRSPPAPTPKLAPRGRADMAASCPNCGHVAAHPCSANSCNCNGIVSQGPADRLSVTEIAICGRLGVSHSEFLKARREEAGRN
jgi:phage I-like protein